MTLHTGRSYLCLTVVRLRASVPVLEARMRRREHGRDPTWYLEVAAALVAAMEQPGIAAYVLDIESEPVADVAAHTGPAAGRLAAVSAGCR